MTNLYLHIGHNKTGSSYIQSSLASSTESLAKAGINYPIEWRRKDSAGSGRISNGNWSEFCAFLERPDTDQGCYLFSSEMIFPTLMPNHPMHGRVQSLLEAFEHVRILLLIRDPISHSCSAYQQSIKRGGNANSLQQYIKTYNGTHTSRVVIETIRSYPNVDLTVINYSRKPSVIQSMSDWLGLKMGDLSLPSQSIVNRSLTITELELQRQINIRMGTNAGHLFADLACNILPDIKPDVVRPSIADQKALWNRLAPDIEFINKVVPEVEKIDIDRDMSRSDLEEDEPLSLSVEQLSLIAENICEKFNNLEALRVQVKKLREQNLALREARLALNERNAALRESNIALREAKTSLDQRNSALKASNIELREAKSTLDQKNAALRENNAVLRTSLEALKSRYGK